MRISINLLIFVLIVGLSTQCKSQTSTGYANELDGCLGIEDIQLLNYLTNKFEQQIMTVYSPNVNKSYKQFLLHVATMNLPQDFFRHSAFVADLKELRESTFFEKAWTKSSKIQSDEEIIEIPPTIIDGVIQQPQQNQYDHTVLKPDGEYIKCLAGKNQNKAINDYLEIVKAGIDVSPGLVAQSLHDNLATEDYETKLTRLVIAINFYYYISLLITDER
ncbi:MAG: hypothetical protein MI921_13030 [Cytophagales bacterium]|nr:hypothetical protein [Cytophagales bacterium]